MQIIRKLSQKTLWASIIVISIASTIYFSLGNKSESGAKKKVMFVVTTAETSGKGVFELYSAMKKVGHDVKIGFLPRDLGNGTIIDIDTDFAARFPSEDVIYLRHTKGKYHEGKHILPENRYDYQADYLFTQDPYNKKLHRTLKKITKKLAHIPYCPQIFHQAYLSDPKLANTVDIVFVDSDSTAKIYLEQYKFPPKNVIISGYQSYKNVRDLSRSLVKSDKETILWLPRWVLSFKNRDKYEGGSTFSDYHYFIYNYALANPKTNFIIRPHELLFSTSVAKNHLSLDDLNNIFDRFLTLPNVVISRHAYRPLAEDIVASNIVISDGSTALGEAVVANKPIIYLSNGWNNEFNGSELAKQLQQYVHLAYEPNDITRHIDLLRKNSYKPLFDQTSGTKFIRALDPVTDPAQFIAEYLLNEPV